MLSAARLAIAAGLLVISAMPGAAQSVPVPLPRPDPDAPPAATATLPPDPPRIYQAACPALRDGLVTGQIDVPISEDRCEADSPLAITAVGEGGQVALSRMARLNCRMATALAEFAEIADGAAREIFMSPLTGIDAGPGYQCRRRNRRDSGKLSEHAFANAIDVVGFELADGRRIAVAEAWPPLMADAQQVSSSAERAKTDEQKYLVRIHAAACELFTTVLGPDANAAHRSHFHFDLGCHGSDCRYYICE